MSLSKESKLEKAEKMVIILILLDIIELYSMEALPGTKQELKQAINSAVKTNKRMTKVAAKYLGMTDISEHFGEAADFIYELIEAYYKNELVEDGDYIKIKIK